MVKPTPLSGLESKRPRSEVPIDRLRSARPSLVAAPLTVGLRGATKCAPLVLGFLTAKCLVSPPDICVPI
jgi:hypothetical protein